MVTLTPVILVGELALYFSIDAENQANTSLDAARAVMQQDVVEVSLGTISQRMLV